MGSGLPMPVPCRGGNNTGMRVRLPMPLVALDEKNMERIGFQQRTGALLIDLGLVMLVVHLFVGLDLLLNAHGNFDFFGLVSGLGAMLVIFAHGLMEIFPGGTLGKRIMGVVIARED